MSRPVAEQKQNAVIIKPIFHHFINRTTHTDCWFVITLPFSLYLLKLWNTNILFHKFEVVPCNIWDIFQTMFYGWVDIICFNNKHGIELEDNFNNLPTIHWLPKVHKRPYKFSYIVNSRSCSTKELSVRMTFV